MAWPTLAKRQDLSSGLPQGQDVRLQVFTALVVGIVSGVLIMLCLPCYNRTPAAMVSAYIASFVPSRQI